MFYSVIGSYVVFISQTLVRKENQKSLEMKVSKTLSKSQKETKIIEKK